MYADAVRCTHNGTGGSSTLTLAAVTGYPQPSDVWSTSGTKRVHYEICEYTDSTFATLSKYERGIGSLVLSTGVLTRTDVLYTASSGTVNAANPTALNFGNTAANIQILFGASAFTQRPALPAIQAAVGDTQWTPINWRQQADSTASTLALSANTEYWIPIEFIYGKPITSIGVEITTGATGNLRLSLYDWDTDGLAGNLLTEFTSGTQIDTSGAAGVHSVTPASKYWAPPGFYWLLLQCNATPTLRSYPVVGNPGAGIHSARDIVYITKSGTYGAAPSTGSKSSLSQSTRSAGFPPSVVIK